jgi:leucyl-tRNA---protein transferase
MENDNFKLGVTKTFPCSYLADKNERLLIALDERLHNNEGYTWLMEQGFRRSGDQIYRPHCESCKACQSIRVMVNEFAPSKSQKRLLKRNADFKIRYSKQVEENYYPLYENYINTIHADGAMFPATPEQFKSFVANYITEQIFIEIWDAEKLISVAVTDKLQSALSAVYTFYHPEYRKSGLGIFSILKQIHLSSQLGKSYLYLGYQIDDCQKMNYKTRYLPHQKLMDNSWNSFKK